MASFSACPQLSKFFAEPTTDSPGRILNWPCFRPGFHKGRQYTPEDIAKIVRNFNRLHGQMKVKIRADVEPAVAKLGHEKDQRLMASLGLPSVGRVFAARLSTPEDRDDRGKPVPEGTLVISIEGIPPMIAETIRQGGYNDGSIELDHEYPDPDNPGETMDGSVLTAVALLGEEQPAVTGLPSPKVSFSASPRGGRSSTVIAFSEVYMNRDELIQKLQSMGIDVTDPEIASLPDGALNALCNQIGSQAFSDCMRAKFAAELPNAGGDPGLNDANGGVAAGPGAPDANMMPAPMANDSDQTPKFSDDDMMSKDAKDEPDMDPKDQKDMMSKFSKLIGTHFARLEKRLQTVEKAVGPKTAAFAAEFSAHVQTEQKRTAEAALAEAVREGQVMPAAKEAYLKQLMMLSNRRVDVFAAGPKAGKTPFEHAIDEMKKLPRNPMFSELANDTGPAAGNEEASEMAQRILSMTADGRKALALAKAK